jgi:hypothetical protein
MAYALSIPNNKEELVAALQTAKGSIARAREKAEEMTLKAVHGAEVIGGAFAISYYNGKAGTGGQPYQIAGHDADTVLGLAGILAGALKVAGKASDHLFFLGLGSASASAARAGWAKGEAAATPAATATATATATAPAPATPATPAAGG